MDEDFKKFVKGWGIIVFTVIIIILIGSLIVPKYRLYSQDLRGQAELREAEWTKKILVEEARAKKDSAILEAEAEIERAKGVAQANEIIGNSLKGNEEYLRYRWIEGLQDGSSEVIYVPTEAGLPILEAGKR